MFLVDCLTSLRNDRHALVDDGGKSQLILGVTSYGLSIRTVRSVRME